MYYFITTFFNLLVINQIHTFDPITLGTIGTLATLDPGLFTTTTKPNIITRPLPTTTTTTSNTLLENLNNTSESTTSAPSTEDNQVLYITLSIVFGLFAAFEMWYFICRKTKKNEIKAQNVEDFYESVDYSTVYELPKVEEGTIQPPPLPDRNNKYGVQVNTII